MTHQTEAGRLPLLPHHAQRIRASAIAEPVANTRGYRSLETRAALKRLGFSDAQCRVPTLLLPIYGITGEIVNYQSRPDEPRIGKDGRPRKYELPTGSQMALDVHPIIRDRLRNPAVPLWITEGVFKADAAISQGLCCLALLGVWNWRGSNDLGGKTALATWESIALNERRVYIAFDSDATTKPQVRTALSRLGAFLAVRDADVHYVYLPSGPGGIKVGLDDWLAAGHTVDDLLALALTELRQAPTDTPEDIGPYLATSSGIIYRRPTQNGPVDQLLSNFTARIAEERVADDGMSERSELVIVGERAGGEPLPRIMVPLARFPTMDWPVRQWGTRAIVTAGMGTKDRLREAIQRLSPDVPQHRVYEHPGWREIPELGWCFLYAGGAISASGPVAGLDVFLHGAASRILLPDIPSGDELCAAVRTFLSLLDLAPDRITAPLFAATYRAVLCEFATADLSLFLVGPSGVYKSELAALVMQHVGTEFDRLHLPAQWSSTPNFLERIAFDFKDVPLVIDDFAPTGSQVDIARLHATADRALRGVGNRGGRGRMNADGSLRPGYPPRGLVIGTGEDAPRGHSLRARMVIVEVGPGDVETDRLSEAQAFGRNGVLVAGLAGFIQWLAGHVDAVRQQLPVLLSDFRARAQPHPTHARTPDAVAHLAVGWQVYLQFAVDINALSQGEAEDLFARIWEALGDAATSQSRHQLGEEPVQRFLDLLGSALSAGFAHVATPSGDAPLVSGAWGWRDGAVAERAQGMRIGWVDGDDLYLDLEAALTASQRVGQATGSPIGVTPKTLAKRLHERGFLRSTEQANGELHVRRTLEGRRRRVLHLTASAITLEESGQSGQSGQSGYAEADIPPAPAFSGCSGRIVWPDEDGGEPESDQEIRPTGAEPDADGRDGRIGRVFDAPQVGRDDHSRQSSTVAIDTATEVVEWSA